jgi:hypothetical protein
MSTNFLQIVIPSNMKSKAYNELNKVVQQRYSGNMAVRNISIGGSFSRWNIPWFLFGLCSPIWLDVQKITAEAHFA